MSAELRPGTGSRAGTPQPLPGAEAQPEQELQPEPEPRLDPRDVSHLTLQRQLASEQALNTDLRAELRSANGTIYSLRKQLEALSSGELVPVAELKREHWIQLISARDVQRIENQIPF